MKSVYETTYAPTEWKKEFAGWDLQREYAAATSRAQSKADLTVAEGRRILMDFVYSMRDYHVSIQFLSTEASSLPLTIRSAEGRYFIVSIDREKLSEELFPFSVGDEVTTFDGRPVADVVAELRTNTAENTAVTDQALAELSLTSRRTARGLPAAQGPVTIGIKAQGSETVSTRQLIWDYKQEEIPPIESVFRSKFPKNEKKSLIPNFQMTANADLAAEDPHAIGSRNSYLPNFGPTIWESEPTDPFQAYIYRDENNKMIGVVRIRSYFFMTEDAKAYDDAVLAFSKIVNRMEKFTDAMVIDQLNNPGGSVFYLYALASTLSPTPMQTPRHTMSITPTEVQECLQTLKMLDKIKTDEDARKEIGEVVHGYPVNLQFLHFYRGYCTTYIQDWKAGQTMSRPFWIAGVDQINPYPKGTYTKPIMVLTNELDFSGGDFFPTILQDNQRAKIFGVRTAGAGGYVNEFRFPSLLGVEKFRVTQSLAHRATQNPIENLGVTPDIAYTMTANDRQNNYADYVKAVKEAIKGLLQ
jgi:C-terminal processing protease CtpA/Prc